MYRAAVEAFEAGRMGDAQGRFEQLLDTAPRSPVAPYAQLYLGRIIAQQDAGLGANKVVALADVAPKGPVRLAARLYGGIASMQAKRCITTKRLLESLMNHSDPRVVGRAAFGLAGCSTGLEALRLLGMSADNEPRYAEVALNQARTLLTALDVKTATQAMESFRTGRLGTLAAENLARLARDRNDPELLQKAMNGLDGTQGEPSTSVVAGATRLGVILPLSGRSRPLGLGLKANLEAYYQNTAASPVADQPTLLIRDGGSPDRAAAAINDLAEEGVFAATGVFVDQTSSMAVAEAVKSAGLPTVMLTRSDAPVTVDGPLWRALHTPILVARSAAGAAMMRGGKTALVLRKNDQYGQIRAHWFRQAWKAGGGQDAGEVVWSKAKPDWRAIAKQVQARQFDTLFIPIDVNTAVQLLRHLASIGVWSKTKQTRFKGERGIREVNIVGPAEWYHPRLTQMGGRYAEGVLVPTPFAVETARGHAFLQRSQGAGKKRSLNAFDALLVDVIGALQQAQSLSESQSLAPAEAIGQVRFSQGASAGMDFSQRDVLPSLFLLEVSKNGFRPVSR